VDYDSDKEEKRSCTVTNPKLHPTKLLIILMQACFAMMHWQHNGIGDGQRSMVSGTRRSTATRRVLQEEQDDREVRCIRQTQLG
jgi:hypothetical protein